MENDDSMERHVQGRRIEDKEDDIPSIISYRLGQLEHAFSLFPQQLKDNLTSLEKSYKERMDKMEQTVSDVAFNRSQIQLQDYRLLQLERWRIRFMAAMTTLATGLVIVLITQIIVLAADSSRL